MRVGTLAALALLGLAGCVPQGGQRSATDAGPGAPISQPDPSAMIASALSGSTVVGTLSNGTPYCEYHGPNGEVIGNDGQGAYQGTWAMSGNQVCYTYPARNIANMCLDVSVQGQQATFLYNGQLGASGALVGGNSCSPA